MKAQRQQPFRWSLSELAGIIGLTALYWFRVRRWFSRWGTTPEELERVMPGDGLIANPTHTSTGAITVNAPPGDIWPWLVQMGTGRGGMYSYDWLDRLFGFLDRPSATRILPEYQALAVGDKIPWGRDEQTVEVLEPNRALALRLHSHGIQWVWQFGLYPLDDQHTRLVNRGTEWLPRTLFWWLYMTIVEPAAFIMTRRFLLGVKQRAEALRASEASATPQIPSLVPPRRLAWASQVDRRPARGAAREHWGPAPPQRSGQHAHRSSCARAAFPA